MRNGHPDSRRIARSKKVLGSDKACTASVLLKLMRYGSHVLLLVQQGWMEPAAVAFATGWLRPIGCLLCSVPSSAIGVRSSGGGIYIMRSSCCCYCNSHPGPSGMLRNQRSGELHDSRADTGSDASDSRSMSR